MPRQAADPALHLVRHPAPPTPAGVRGTVGHWGGTPWRPRGRGTLYSFVVMHFPQVAVLRLPAPLSGWWSWRKGHGWWPTSTGSCSGGAGGSANRCASTFVDFDDELSLPVFVAARPRRRGSSLMDFSFTDVQQAVSDAAYRSLSGSGRRRSSRRVRSSPRDARRPRPVAGAGRVPTSRAWPSPRSRRSGLWVERSSASFSGRRETSLPHRCRCGPRWCSVRCRGPVSAHPEQRGRWLPRVVTGEVMLTAALTSCANSVHEGRRAIRGDTPRRLDGSLSGVEAGGARGPIFRGASSCPPVARTRAPFSLRWWTRGAPGVEARTSVDDES